MLAAPLDSTSLTPEQTPPAASIATATQRKVLGETSSTSRSVRSGRSTSTTVTAAAASSPLEDVFGPTGSGPSSKLKPNARMQVFVDPSGASAAEEALAHGDTMTTPWNELGSRKERIKENVPKVSKLGGSTLRQQRVTSAPAASSLSSRIAVFRDPAPGEGDPMPPPPPAAAPSAAKVRGKEREMASKTPARPSTIVPFKDEVKETPATPRFVPFKDDVPSTPSTSSGAHVPESVMKVKAISTKGLAASSEAEALRKDPFKNYPDKPPLETEG